MGDGARIRTIHAVAVRLVTLLVGVAAIVWGGSLLPGAFLQSTLNRIADHVVAGDPINRTALAQFSSMAEAGAQEPRCGAVTLRAAAIINLRLLELDLHDGEREEAIDPRMDSLLASLHRALACSPADPFLWLALYWADMNRDGFQPRDLQYLRLSYSLGPNEGWIALKRNGLALAIFDQLPADLRDRAVAEFANLLNSQFESEAVAILTGPGWKARGRLLAKLKDVKEDYRKDFARALYRGGYDVVVPGIKLREARPWD